MSYRAVISIAAAAMLGIACVLTDAMARGGGRGTGFRGDHFGGFHTGGHGTGFRGAGFHGGAHAGGAPMAADITAATRAGMSMWA